MSQTKVKSGLLNFPDQTDFVKLPSGTTAQRPSSPEKGYSRYNTTDNKLEYWNGTIWQQLPGVTPPTIESVSYPGDDLAADPAGGQTITLTGTNFLNGASIEIDGTTASVVTVVSATEITFTAPAKAAGDYDILLTNGDSTTATYVDGITYNGLPSWTTPAGNLGTFVAGSTIPTITLVATEPDSGVVSYSVTTGALPTGLTLTGADIDGTVPTPAGQTTYNFSVTASDDENQSTERAFNIVVYLQVTNTVDDHDPFDGNGVALYQLNGDATDESGNYDGTATNVTWGGAGVFGTSASFNGSSSKIINTSSLVTGNSDRTLSVWMKTTNTTSGMVLLTLGSETGAANNQWAIGFRDGDDDGVIIYGYGQANEVGWGSLGVNVKDGQWHHLAVSWNGSQLSWFVDGSNVLIQPFAHTYATSSGIQIGTWSEDIFWDGEIDQVRVFDTALTPLEVESLYKERIVLCGGQADTLDILGDNSCIATYQLNGNANDLSGNYSGTLVNINGFGVGNFDLAVDNTTGYMNLPASLCGATHTFSSWVYMDTLPSYVRYYNQWNGSSGSWIGGFSNGYLNVEGGVYGAIQSVTNPIIAGQWNHIVFIRDNGTWNFYVNGGSAGSFTLSNSLNTTLNTQIIGYGDNPGNNLIGKADQVRIFNKALNSTEVTTLYNETACDALACGGTTNTLDILSDGSCIAAYPLDGSPADLSGNYNGVQTDVTYPQGYFDLSGSFNGSSGGINTPLNTTNIVSNINDITQNFSFSLWMKPQAYGSSNVVFSINAGDPTYQYIGLVMTATGVNFVHYPGGASGNVVSTTTDLDVWTQITCIRESSYVKLYKNGTFIGQDLITTGNSTIPSDKFWAIGYRPFLNDLYFKGQIDQVRIFNKALSAGEVTTLYNETACN